jgi:chaperone modulatory protein CbpM
VTWLDSRETLTAAELSRTCGMSPEQLAELVEYGALVPLDRTVAEPVFSGACVSPLRKAARLYRDFDLDLFAVAMLLGYLNRIEELEHEVHSLRARIPGHAHLSAREGPQPWREPHG